MWTVGPEVTFFWSRLSYLANFSVQVELESESATDSII